MGDAAVFGMPDDEWGEEVKAVVEPAPGVDASDDLADELLAHCDGVAGALQVPAHASTSPTRCPRDPNGKLYKRRLRDPYWTGRERSI